MRAALLAISLIAAPAFAEDIDEATIARYIGATFGKASPEWQARMAADETIATCNATRNRPSPAEAAAIEARERARVVPPADGKALGDWREGFRVANSGLGGQFSDAPGTVNGGNCYACHQLDPAEISYGTLGPSLTGYGKARAYDPAAALAAYGKIFNSQSVLACSSMPRFGASKVLSERQIKDLVAYLFDPESPVNK